MKKKMVWIAGAVIILVLLGLGIAAGVTYSRQRDVVSFKVGQEGETDLMEPTGTAQLITEVQSEEEAQELAELYGITLQRVTGTLAVFETTEDPMSVVERGEANGWKMLWVDTMYYISEE